MNLALSTHDLAFYLMGRFTASGLGADSDSPPLSG